MKWIVDASFLLEQLGRPPEDLRGKRISAFLNRLKDARALSAPALLALEVGNFLHGPHRRAAGETRDDRLASGQALLEGTLLEPFSIESMRAVAALAEDHGLSFYDATYLEHAARSPQFGLLTDDGPLIKGARSALGKGRVKTSADF